MSVARWLMAAALLLVGVPRVLASGLRDMALLGQATINAYCSPASVQIGEPFDLTLDIVHDSALRILLHTPEDGGAQPFGEQWEVLEPQRSVRLPLNDGSGRQLTQVRWRLFGLEPGEFELPTLGADCVASGALQRLEAPSASLVVRGELQAEEDTPRASAGMREPPDEVRSPLGLITRGLGTALVLALAGFVALLVRRRRKRKPPSVPPSALERLQGFDPSDASELRNLHFDVSRIVREALEGPDQEALAGCTDEEWLARQRQHGQLSEELVGRTAELLERCGEVKYAASLPTRWAAEETLQAATSICSEASKERQEACP